jgi:hypothetical protein
VKSATRRPSHTTAERVARLALAAQLTTAAGGCGGTVAAVAPARTTCVQPVEADASGADVREIHAALAAIAALRSAIEGQAEVMTALRTQVARAVARAERVPPAGYTPAALQGGAEPDVDEELLEWIMSQPAEPPFSPDVYAGRVGRLRADVVGHVVQFQLQLFDVWRLLAELARGTRVADVRAARDAARPDAPEPVVTFQRDAAGTTRAVLAGTLRPPGPGGLVAIHGAGIAPGSTRRSYAGGALSEADLGAVAVPIALQPGLGSQVRAALVQPWVQYRARLRALSQSVDALGATYDTLRAQLAPSGSRRDGPRRAG